MRKLCMILLVTMILSGGIQIRGEGSNVILYVSPEATANGDGTASNPYTPEAAIDAAADMGGGVTVEFAGGTYYLEKPLVIDEDCSDVTIKAADGETPVISGGEKLGTWTNHSGNIYKTKLPDSIAEGTDVLEVNGAAAVRSHNEQYYTGDWYNDPDVVSEGGIDGVKVSSTYLSSLASPADAEVEWQWSWRHHRMPVESAKTEGSYFCMTLKMPDFEYARILQHTSNNPRFTVYNAYELMDTPGEFFCNTAEKMIYYYKRDGEDMTTASAVAGRLEKVLEVKGSTPTSKLENLKISGITFAHTADLRSLKYGLITEQSTSAYDMAEEAQYLYPEVDVRTAAVWVSNADNMVLENNIFRDMQTLGLGLYEGVTNSRVSGNVFKNLGSAGMTVGLPIHRDDRETAVGMTDVALRKKAYSSDMFRHNKADFATDGNYGTSWQSQTSANHWLKVDLGAAYTINRIEIEGSCGNYFAIEASNSEDFSNYTTLKTVMLNNSDYSLNVSNSTKFRYVRIMQKTAANITVRSLRVFTKDLNNVPTTQLCGNNEISNNLFTDIAHRNVGQPAIQTYYIRNTEIIHNEIYNVPYSGICLGWGWAWSGSDNTEGNHVSYNRIEKFAQNTYDGGGIYTLGVQNNTVISRNYIKDSFYPLGGGIYTDNGSKYVEVTENVIEDVPFPHFHYATDTSYIKAEDNYVSSPSYSFGAQNSYMDNTEIFVKGFMPDEAKKIADNAGLENEYAHLREHITEATDKWENARHTSFPSLIAQDGCDSAKLKPYVEEAEFVLETAEKTGIIGDNADLAEEIKALVTAARTYMSGTMYYDVCYDTYVIPLRKKLQEFIDKTFESSAYIPKKKYINSNVETNEGYLKYIGGDDFEGDTSFWSDRGQSAVEDKGGNSYMMIKNAETVAVSVNADFSGKTIVKADIKLMQNEGRPIWYFGMNAANNAILALTGAVSGGYISGFPINKTVEVTAVLDRENGTVKTSYRCEGKTVTMAEEAAEIPETGTVYFYFNGNPQLDGVSTSSVVIDDIKIYKELPAPTNFRFEEYPGNTATIDAVNKLIIVPVPYSAALDKNFTPIYRINGENVKGEKLDFGDKNQIKMNIGEAEYTVILSFGEYNSPGVLENSVITMTAREGDAVVKVNSLNPSITAENAKNIKIIREDGKEATTEVSVAGTVLTISAYVRANSTYYIAFSKAVTGLSDLVLKTKYTYSVQVQDTLFISGKTGSGSKITNLSGKVIGGKAMVKNVGTYSGDITMVIAVKDAEGKLMAIDFNNFTISPGASKVIYAGLDNPLYGKNASGCCAEMMFFEDIGNIIPVAEKAVLEG